MFKLFISFLDDYQIQTFVYLNLVYFYFRWTFVTLTDTNENKYVLANAWCAIFEQQLTIEWIFSIDIDYGSTFLIDKLKFSSQISGTMMDVDVDRGKWFKILCRFCLFVILIRIKSNPLCRLVLLWMLCDDDWLNMLCKKRLYI